MHPCDARGLRAGHRGQQNVATQGFSRRFKQQEMAACQQKSKLTTQARIVNCEVKIFACRRRARINQKSDVKHHRLPLVAFARVHSQNTLRGNSLELYGIHQHSLASYTTGQSAIHLVRTPPALHLGFSAPNE